MSKLKTNINLAIPSAVYASSFATDLLDWPGEYDEVVGYIDCTASSVPTSLDVDYETSVDGGTTWYAHTSFTQITTTGSQRLVFTRPAGIRARLNVTIVGTSFTFSLRLEGKKEGR